ncbi:MAG: N-acetyltransferase family protein [Byssovorax sp.]
MLIRAARESDFDAVAEVTNHYIRETAIHFGSDPVTPAELRDAWWSHREMYPFLVAEVEGRFAGFSKAGSFRERAAYAWITETTVYVAPGMERKGAGKALYTRLFAILREQGFETAIGGIALPNEASVLLHESMGFVKIAHVAKAGWKLGRFHDLGFWQRDLTPPSGAPRAIVPPIYG